VIEPALLVQAYRQGIFPMALEDDEIGWFSPDPRGILPLDRCLMERFFPLASNETHRLPFRVRRQ
jgi:Leu/Phe-tRNA-protein transferase